MYMYILKLLGIMYEAKKDIMEKTKRSNESTTMAIKVSNRKFVLRLIRLS